MNRTRIPTNVSHLSVTQAARFVGVSQPLVTRRIQQGRLATVTVHGVVMVSVRALRAWKQRVQRARRSLARVQRRSPGS
jgi:hypothetical protein